MTKVIIQPARGNPEGRRNWKMTIDQDVYFRAPARISVLTPEQQAGLEALHPEGKARFWGTTSNHERSMSVLGTGDVVLFTGQGRVGGVGEVGYLFRNAAFADTLWEPSPEKGSYENVYSLLTFQPTTIPYREVWDLLGSKEGDNFMGLRLLDDEKSEAIIAGLRIETKTAAQQALRRDAEVFAPEEQMNVVLSRYNQLAGTILVHRREAQLVSRYRATIDDAQHMGRLKLSSRFTDLYVCRHDALEIVEAKRDSTREMVREALAQLLDYALDCPHPISRLTALFPACPADDSVELLHRYGIDCVHEGEPGIFHREPAPDSQREHMMLVWAASAAPAS
ncbi:MAG: hypothetical protein ACJ73S_02430 [Mycobacteriales bacterium]